MNSIFNWLKSSDKNKEQTANLTSLSVDFKRSNSKVNFIHPGHPLYDNIVAQEDNQLHILAPNETAYNENSLTHNFVAIVTYKDMNYLVINSFKHFKEQSIGGLLQFDENLYNVIPFYETSDEYQTANDYTFSETYEYDHPVESYAFLAIQNNKTTKLTLERGKKPIVIKMIDTDRNLFTSKLPNEQINLIDFVVMPAFKAYEEIQEKLKMKQAK